MYSDEDLKDLSIKVLHKLDQKFNFSEAEVYIQSLSHMMGGIEYRTPKVYQSTNRAGCAIRFFKDEELYFACFPLSTVLKDIDSLKNIITFPIKSKKFRFPEIVLSSAVSKIYDKRIASLNEEEIFNLTYSLNDLEEKMEDVILDGSILFSLERKVIANSSQSLAFEKSTWNELDLRALYRGFDMISSSEKHLTSRQIPSSLSSTVDALVKDTIQRSTISKIQDASDMTAIFSPMAFSQIFSFAFVPLLKNVNRESMDKLDLSENIHLYDDGTVPGLPNSTAFDDEGVPQSKTIVIRNGEIITPLNNAQFRNEDELPTGNSFRINMYETFPRNYQAYPDIFPSNLLIGEGVIALEQIMEDLKEGILINSTQGYMTADYHTGMFKVSANDAYRIEDGEIVGFLPTFDLTGNIFDILKNYPVLSKERKVVRPRNTPYSLVAPYILTRETSIFV